MFIFGHLGIGNQIARPWSRGLSTRWILFGTLMPDIIDKILYYSLSLTTGLKGADLGRLTLISGTRTFGHTALLLIVLTVLAQLRKSRELAALSLGMATHLLLDNVYDRLLFGEVASFSAEAADLSSAFQALVFPYFGLRFAVIPFRDVGEHFWAIFANKALMGTEIVGVALLAWHGWKNQYGREMMVGLRSRRVFKRKIKNFR